MNSTSAQFVSSRRMGAYEPIHNMGMWGESFKTNGNLNASASIIVEADPRLSTQSEDNSNGILGSSEKYYQEVSNKPPDKVKVLRRLAQNREAARKSRLRKKAYVQQLETCKEKLVQLEQEVNQARKHGIYTGVGIDPNSLSFAGSPSAAAIAAFEMEYDRWVEEEIRLVCDMRTALNAHASDVELRMLVDQGMNHFYDLFRMKATAAKSDVFYVWSGMWKTSAERFFMWIGGFRPSELLKILGPHLEPLTEQQLLDVFNLRQSCQQAEDALFQGTEKLQQMLAESVAAGQLGEGSYSPQVGTAMEKLVALESFLNQADNLRQVTLQQMARILTTRQAARGLLAMGEYFQRLRALSSLWGTRHPEPT